MSLEAATKREIVIIEASDDVEAIAFYEQAMQADPEDVDPYVSLAWLLATHPDERLRDGERAVTLAQRALALGSGPVDLYFLETLAAAHAEAGDHEDAVFWRTQSLSAAASHGCCQF